MTWEKYYRHEQPTELPHHRLTGIQREKALSRSCDV